MGDIDDGDALALEVLHDLEQGLHLAEGQRAGGLVQDEHLRVAHHAAKQLDQLLLGDGERVGLALEAEGHAQLLHVPAQALFQLAFIFGKAHEDVFKHRHVGEEKRLLRHQVDAGRQRRRRLAQPGDLAVQQNFAGVTGVNPHDDLHQRGFARAVAADERDHLAGAHAQIDPFEDDVLPERLLDSADLKARHGRLPAHICCHVDTPAFR